MAGEAIIIGEVLVGVLQAFVLRYKALGLSEAEVESELLLAIEKASQTKPEDLPDV